MNRSLWIAATLLGLASCRAPTHLPDPEVSSWGTMREVLREGQTEGRVSLAEVAGPNTVGVGALAGLAGEVTILDGRVLVAAPVPPGASHVAPAHVDVREAMRTEQAALLVVADVPDWQQYELGDCASYEELESAIAAQLRQREHDLTDPIPVRVRGVASLVEFHVIAGACPIATPDGPPPWRHRGADQSVELVGFFAEGAAGRLTHHTHRSHLHVVAGALMGHLDEVALRDAVLLLPAR